MGPKGRIYDAGVGANSMSETSRSTERVNLTWLGQAGFRIEFAGNSVFIDPFVSEYPSRLVPAQAGVEDLALSDLILVTHEHEDHLDLNALTSLPYSLTKVVVPSPLAELTRQKGVRHTVVGARPDEILSAGAVRVFPVPSMHGVHVADSYNFGFDISNGEHRYLGYVVEIGGLRIYHSGDTIDYPELASRLAHWEVDIALLPINGRDKERESQDIVGNLTALESVNLAQRAGVRCVIPMHYDMFENNLGPLGEFVDAARAITPQVHVLVPRVGGSIPLPTRNELLMKGVSK